MNVSDEPELCRIDTVDWPREGRQLMCEAAGLLTLAMRIAADRARHGGEDAAATAQRMMLEKTNRFQDARIDVLLRRLNATNPKHRAHYDAHDRCLIVQWAAERGWSAREMAAAFAIDESTARHWLQEWRDHPDSSLFCGVCAWNSYDDALKDLVHRVQSLFPELHIGARTIANYILRAAIAISRSTVRRHLQEAPPSAPAHDEFSAPKSLAPAAVLGASTPVETFHVLQPDHVNHVWHADFTQFNVFWMTFWVTSIMDGFSRRLMALKVSLATPTTGSVVNAFKAAAAQFGAPRFVITDKGSQFRESFANLLRPLRIGVIHGPVQRPQFNGKIERFFRTLKLWQRPACGSWLPNLAFIQRCFDSFREWYNHHRVHQGILGLTPDEAWSGTQRDKPVRYFARDNLNPVFTVQRLSHNGDPRLPVFDIRVRSKKPA